MNRCYNLIQFHHSLYVTGSRAEGIAQGIQSEVMRKYHHFDLIAGSSACHKERMSCPRARGIYKSWSQRVLIHYDKSFAVVFPK